MHQEHLVKFRTFVSYKFLTPMPPKRKISDVSNVIGIAKDVKREKNIA
jgi:hypothetical protein